MGRLTPQRKVEKEDAASLLFSPYDDAPAILYFHVKAMAVEQGHADEWRAPYRVGLNVPWLIVPEHGDAVHVEANFRVVSQGRPAAKHVGQL